MILGIDVGTTAVKAILLDQDARVIGEGAQSHDLRCPHPGWAEEDPEDWWRGAIRAVRGALSGHDATALRGIGVSGMVPVIVLLDKRGHVIRPSIQQSDARAVREIRELSCLFPEEELFNVAGASWNQQVVGPKLLWIRRNEPEAWSRTDHIVGSYEYIVRRLTGIAHCEANWALESGLWEVERARWIPGVLHAVGIDETQLPPVRRSDDLVGTVTREAAHATGIPEGLPVTAGGADHIASILPTGSTRAGQAVVKLGGAGDLLLTVEAFRPVRSLFIDYHCIPGLYVVNGCMATSGSVLKWFARECAPDKTFAELDREAGSVPAGCEGVVTLPYFLGEKTPIHDPLARGTVIGLSLSHRSAHIYRSMLEGVAFAFRHHFDVLTAAGHRIADVAITGGGARSDVWCGILASVLERPLRRPQFAHVGSALGIALTAGVATGAWDWEFVTETQGTGDVIDPESSDIATYRRLYGVYREAYERLRQLYPHLAPVDGAEPSAG